ncbi:FAD-dependent oxidoreductase domain-containing protein 1-like [Gordionus sp. m RMFG-2023]|uniref:FAD-dependent oxidoreductase domain-containing protein 1-like n=1 Tax=Gordionus sp. m RMFG-2023 TaxID=3053472 RepID=UPI0031FD4728
MVKIKRALKYEADGFKSLIKSIHNIITAQNNKIISHDTVLPHIYKNDYEFPFETDILIIGSGVMGLSASYWLKYFARQDISVVIVEKDIDYSSSTSLLSMGGIRQQYSLEENIKMSLFGAHFIRNYASYFRLPLSNIEPPKISYNPQGYLMLASSEGVDQLHSNYLMQREYGCHTKLLSPANLKLKFPWLNIEGIELASYGLYNEGWFDAWELMMNFKTYGVFHGVKHIHGQLLGFESKTLGTYYDPITHQLLEFKRPNKAILNVKWGDGTIQRKKILFSKLINASGINAADVAQMLDIGSGEIGREIPLPVEPRQRYVYVINCPEGPILDCPFLIDKSGLALRRHDLHGNYLVLLSPQSEEFSEITNDAGTYFETNIRPILTQRIPCFKNLKVVKYWCGFYDYNFVDQNAIIGPHPYHTNVYMINGFSGHGLQHSPAAGRAIAEHIFHDDYVTLDLNCFKFERFSQKELVFDKHII